MPNVRSAFRALPRVAGSRLESVTKSISADANARVRAHLAAKGLTVVGENSRRHVMARGSDVFYKSLTPDSARRLADFYPRLEAAAPTAGFVPRLLGIESVDERVSVACFEYVEGRGGTVGDSGDCVRLYAALQASALEPAGGRVARAVVETCRAEVSTWTEELLRSWDPFNWTDPKILEWGGVDATAMAAIGVPALRSVPRLLSALAGETSCAPVHADLYVGNYLRTALDRAVIFDWDEGYWGLPGMGLQILLREAADDGIEGLDYGAVLDLAPQWAELGLDENDLALRTLASAVIEIAGVRQSLRELGRSRQRHAAYLAAWACRYRWVIEGVDF